MEKKYRRFFITTSPARSPIDIAGGRSWGRGTYGRLGHGDQQDQLLPKKIEAFLGASWVSPCVWRRSGFRSSVTQVFSFRGQL